MSFELKIDALLGRMTLVEKVGQMCQLAIFIPDLEDRIRQGHAGSIICSNSPTPGNTPQDPVLALQLNEYQRLAVEESRLGIPILFGRDVLHGYKTVGPIPLGQAATWNPEIIESVARVTACEASADGINLNFAPVIDIARDPRWGRIAEGFGEDPHLCSVLAQAAVRGYQGEDLTDPATVLACAKHFAGYGAVEGGRDYNGTEIAATTLRNIYLPPFWAAVRAGVGAIMSGFHDIGGIPMSAHRELVAGILKEEWGFEGFVISDWAAIDEMRQHGVAETRADCALISALAGLDMDMASEVYIDELAALVETNQLAEAVIDDAVRRVLRAKFRLGLFDQPYTDVKRASLHLSPDHRQVVRKAAEQSLVLLKNDGILPLAKSDLTVGVFGPLANARKTLCGAWNLDGHEDSVLSILDAVRDKVGANVEILATDLVDDALKIAPRCDVVIAVVGEGIARSGENNCITTLDLPPGHQAFLEALHAIQVPTAAIVLAGRPLALEWADRNLSAILMVWHPGTEGAKAITDTLFGDHNPSGKSPVTFPRNVGQVPLHYNHRPTGRPLPRNDRRHSRYADAPDSPLYPFGYGLSYSTFEYRNLHITVTAPRAVSISAEITNTSSTAGDEIAQLYIRDVVASISRPVKELKGFSRLSLKPGETQTVVFQLTQDDLSFYNQSGHLSFEPGLFKVWVGPDSNTGLAGQFELK
ncbi:MAG: glycoside hydrolase family 3 C-terminal domain-containing protein [Anaerolineae bacterium]|nr:glycoside hydrolase family 3 C-terminal domain-containing protein [Anaerolineae bacterium]